MEPRVLFADEVTLVTCARQERSLQRVMPRYLHNCTDTAGTLVMGRGREEDCLSGETIRVRIY